jgi:3-hydroxyacyl-[acyl-carrier-protein] dehydratase
MATGSAALHLRVDEPAAEGHFPGNPIVPGAVLLREILRILAPDGAAACCEIRSARFFRPVRPGDRLTVRWEGTPAAGCAEGRPEGCAWGCNVTCSTDSDERVLTGTFRLRVR